MFVEWLVVILIVLSLGPWLGQRWLVRIVRIRQALVIYSRLTGQVQQVVAGPKQLLVGPLAQTLPLDLTACMVRLELNHVIAADLPLTASLDVVFGFDPNLLKVTQLNQTLPLLSEPERMVQVWANYLLRTLATGYTTADLLTPSSQRARFDRSLQQTLQDRLQLIGVRIYTCRLLFQPMPRILEAQLAAAQTQLAAQAQAQALDMLVKVLGPEHTGNILLLEYLKDIRPENILAELSLSFPLIYKAGDGSSALVRYWPHAGLHRN